MVKNKQAHNHINVNFKRSSDMKKKLVWVWEDDFGMINLIRLGNRECRTTKMSSKLVTQRRPEAKVMHLL